MTDQDRYVQRILDGWQTRAESARNPSIENLRERGRCCANCEERLPMPWSAGFRQCPACRPDDTHAIYLIFVYRAGVWHCRFLDEGPEGTLINEVIFANAEKVRETARHGKAMTFSMAKLRMDHALSEHREGRLWLQLNAQQYLDLRRYRH